MNIKNLKTGDVLLAHNKDRKHTVIYYKDGKVISASINEKGTTIGGEPGDQTGREIALVDLKGKFDVVLRYKDENVSEAAALFALSIANDDSHGYDQLHRWNENGDFDCSSLVIESYESVGVPVKNKGGATWTGNMKSAFKKCGFVEVDVDQEPEEEVKPEPVDDSDTVYKVKKGDTLSKIAKANKTSVAELVRINGIKDPDKIYIGQKIYLPQKVVIELKTDDEFVLGKVNTVSLPLNVRKTPNGKIIRTLPKGSTVSIKKGFEAWGELKDGGFVYMLYFKLI